MNSDSNNDAMIKELTHLIDNFSPSQVLAQSINLNLTCERIRRIKKKTEYIIVTWILPKFKKEQSKFLDDIFYRGKGSTWIDANTGA